MERGFFGNMDGHSLVGSHFLENMGFSNLLNIVLRRLLPNSGLPLYLVGIWVGPLPWRGLLGFPSSG